MLFRPLLLTILLILHASSASAELVVVVNAHSGVERLTRDEVVNIFMGRYRQLPSGIPALPIDQPLTQPARARFYRLLVDKDTSEINAYWSRLIFSGKTSPPRQAESVSEVLEWLAKQKGAIGYIERSQVTPQVKIVFDLGP